MTENKERFIKSMDFTEVCDFIRDTTESTRIYVGCDSLTHQRRVKKGNTGYASYSRVVVVHYSGQHGCKVFGDLQVMQDYGNMRQRLMTEVGLVIELLAEIEEAVGDRHIEVHLDVNSKVDAASNVVMKEAMGYVRGCTGIDPKVKPDAWAASYAADQFVRGRVGATVKKGEEKLSRRAANRKVRRRTKDKKRHRGA